MWAGDTATCGLEPHVLSCVSHSGQLFVASAIHCSRNSITHAKGSRATRRCSRMLSHCCPRLLNQLLLPPCPSAHSDSCLLISPNAVMSVHLEPAWSYSGRGTTVYDGQSLLISAVHRWAWAYCFSFTLVSVLYYLGAWWQVQIILFITSFPCGQCYWGQSLAAPYRML